MTKIILFSLGVMFLPVAVQCATGPEIEATIKLLGTTDYAKAEAELVKIGDAAIPYLISEASANFDEYTQTRYNAMSLLCKVGLKSDEAFRFFVKAVKDNSEDFGYMALSAVKKMTVAGAKEAYPKLFKIRHDADMELALESWKKDYPDSYDYNGVPLGLIAESYTEVIQIQHPIVLEPDNFNRAEPLLRIVKDYPKSKVAPLAAFTVYSYEETDKLIKEWGETAFPSAARGFGGWAIAGASVAPVAQYFYATVHEPGSKSAWEKFLAYYPDRLSGTKRILPEEYSYIFTAYFTLLDLPDDEESKKRLEDEILKMPEQRFRHDSVYKLPYPEVYLRKARRFVAEEKYQLAEDWLYKVVDEYMDAAWGDHGGGLYEDEALRLNDFLPAKYMVELIRRLSLNEKVRKARASTLDLLLVKALADSGHETEAEKLLVELFEKNPQDIINTIEPYDLRHSIVLWSPEEADTPLKRAYTKLANKYKK